MAKWACSRPRGSRLRRHGGPGAVLVQHPSLVHSFATSHDVAAYAPAALGDVIARRMRCPGAAHSRCSSRRSGARPRTALCGSLGNVHPGPVRMWCAGVSVRVPGRPGRYATLQGLRSDLGPALGCDVGGAPVE